jgi:hypothetical protein
MSSGTRTRSQSSSSGQDPNESSTPDDDRSSATGETSIEFTPAQEAAILVRCQDYMRQHTPQSRSEQSFATPNLGSASASSAQAVSNIFPREIETPGQVASKDLFVDEKKYKQTSSDVLTSIRACKITSSSFDNKKKIKTFLDNMRSTGLYTMVIGLRLMPVCSATNPNGFVPRRHLIMDDTFTIQNQDDCYHWDHDYQRTFMLCMEFFDQTLHYHCKDDITRCDGVAMYAKLMTIVDGKFLKDIERARKALYETYHISPSKPIAQELDRLQTCISDFEYAQDAILSERQKMDILSVHIYKDPRQIIVSTFLAARTVNKTYEQAKQEIIDTCNDLPPGIAIIKLANMNVAQDGIQYCNAFAKGSCRFGDKCRFQHTLNPADKIAPGKKEDKKPVDKNKKPVDKKVPPQVNYSNVRLAAGAHALVGPPRGKPHHLNERGYSVKQKEQINAIIAGTQEIPRAPNPPPAQESCWGSPDMNSFMTDPSPSNIYINSMRHVRDKIPPGDESETNEDEEQEYFLKPAGHTPARSAKRAKYDAAVAQSPYSQRPGDTALGPDANAQLILCDQEMDRKVAGIYAYGATHQVKDFVIWAAQTKLNDPLDKRPKTPVLVILGWIKNAPYLQRVCSIPHLLRNSDYTIMSLLYHIGETYLHAVVTHPDTSCSYRGSESFNSFNPIGEDSINDGRGQYVSNHVSIEEYLTDILFLDSAPHMSDGTKLIVKVAILLDFMAFASCVMREYMEVSTFTEEETRSNLAVELFAKTSTTDDDMYPCFLAIIWGVRIPSSAPAAACSYDSSSSPSSRPNNRQIDFQSPEHISSSQNSIQPSVPRCENQSTTPTSNPTSPAYDSSSSLSHVNVLTVKDKIIKMNSMNSMPSVIFDSGATKSGTCHRSLMTDIKPCHQLSVQGPFGASISPKEEGLITTLKIPCVHIGQLEGTILSVSDISKKDIVMVFTSEGCRGFTAQSVREALKMMKTSGVEVLRGIQENGLYVQSPLPPSRQSPARSDEALFLTLTHPPPGLVNGEKMYYKNAAPTSLYDQVHHALGHPGEQGMAWHKKHTIGAAYTEEDATQARSLCRGCVEGGMRQMSTDHRRVHRPRPTEPGQQFSCDAFQCKTQSARGFHYCDFFTDLCTRIVYPVFTKTRSAEELCKVISLLFDAHPSWKPNRNRAFRSFVIDDDDAPTPPDSDRFIRLDAETSYRSAEFQAMAHRYGYRLQHNPSS